MEAHSGRAIGHLLTTLLMCWLSAVISDLSRHYLKLEPNSSESAARPQRPKPELMIAQWHEKQNTFSLGSERPFQEAEAGLKLGQIVGVRHRARQ